MLLTLVAAACASCLMPPEYEVAPNINQPVSIDESKLAVAPDFYAWSGCDQPTLAFDITQALSNPDDDELTIVWLVNYEAGNQQSIDALDALEFELAVCFQPKITEGALQPNSIEVHVFDRKPKSLNNADDALTPIEGSDTTTASAKWYLAVEDRTCCVELN
ncbi:MAG: hypothetical protein CSA24_01460 [Deltaproteobacteria bacterium]|nr:MAG: hypothetical protein CSA24_01460 [Deltaproteobacteria bacterium]